MTLAGRLRHGETSDQRRESGASVEDGKMDDVVALVGKGGLT